MNRDYLLKVLEAAIPLQCNSCKVWFSCVYTGLLLRREASPLELLATYIFKNHDTFWELYQLVDENTWSFDFEN